MWRSTSRGCWPSRPTRWPGAISCRKQARRSRRRRSATSPSLAGADPSRPPSPTTSWPRWAGCRAPLRWPIRAALAVSQAAGRRPDARAAAQGPEPRDPGRASRATCRAASRSLSASSSTLRPIRVIEPGAFDLVITCIGYDGVAFPARARACLPSAGPAAGRAGPSRPTVPTAMPGPSRCWPAAAARSPKSRRESEPDPDTSVGSGWHRIDKAEIAAGAAQPAGLA